MITTCLGLCKTIPFNFWCHNKSCPCVNWVSFAQGDWWQCTSMNFSTSWVFMPIFWLIWDALKLLYKDFRFGFIIYLQHSTVHNKIKLLIIINRTKLFQFNYTIVLCSKYKIIVHKYSSTDKNVKIVRPNIMIEVRTLTPWHMFVWVYIDFVISTTPSVPK
jgi:hypothetical protein